MRDACIELKDCKDKSLLVRKGSVPVLEHKGFSIQSMLLGVSVLLGLVIHCPIKTRQRARPARRVSEPGRRARQV